MLFHQRIARYEKPELLAAEGILWYCRTSWLNAYP